MSDYVGLFSARTHARIMALRLLYQAELTGRPVDDLIADGSYQLDNEFVPTCRQPIGSGELTRDCINYDDCEYRAFFDEYGVDAIDPYSIDIARGVFEKQDQIDALIGAASLHWEISRMPVVDRAIVRMATWEILRNSPEVPASVAIHEAVNIAKEYGGEDSSKFVNGVLGEITKSVVEEGIIDG